MVRRLSPEAHSRPLEPTYTTESSPPYGYPSASPSRPRPKERYWLHILLFLLTLASTIYAGGHMVGRYLAYGTLDAGALLTNPGFLLDGLRFGGSLLLFLSVHEFGHYFAARRHGVDTSLPYYIPFPFNGIGTFGAVIRIREVVPSLRKLFDIGAAGPLAGFVVALGVLLYGLVTLPPPEYLLAQAGHEPLKAYIQQYGTFPDDLSAIETGPAGTTLVVGQTLLYWLLTQFFADVPPMYEMYHYPFLFAGWLGLFFTALNLLPVGQLDGGHILYALVGPTWHRRLARGFVLVILASGSIGFLESVVPALYAWSDWAGRLSWFILAGILYLYLNRAFDGDHRMVAPSLLGIIALTGVAQAVGAEALRFGWFGWFIFGALVVFLVRVEHPPVGRREPLTPGRRVLGILSIIIFILCFSLRPLYLV